MDIAKLIESAREPAPYEKGTASMWTDPYISRQLLKLHLDPLNDMASRSAAKIDLTVDWILGKAPPGRLSILDLGCGPGLYAERLAARGHRVTGIDFSEVSIDYARKAAEASGSGIEYRRGDYLSLRYSERFDLAIMIYLDFCVLDPGERSRLLAKAYEALKPGGLFIFDAVNEKNVGEKTLAPSWEARESGFWRGEPYLVLNKGYHFPAIRALANQHIVVGGEGRIDTYLFWSSYYRPEELEPILAEAGFASARAYGGFLPGDGPWDGDNITFYVAAKGSPS